LTASRIDGTGLARALRADLAERAARLAALGRQPGLAVILVGDDPASEVYVRNKIKACEEAGIRSVLERYDANFAEAALLARIAALNADPAIHGILVQMPLPKHITAAKVIEAISVDKDVDGYSAESAGRLVAGLPGFRPCTPWGCMKLIESTGIDLRGKHAVVIGRSNTVGKPMALMLLQADATVTVCHSRTPDLAAHTLRRHEPQRREQAVRRHRFRERRRGRRRRHAGSRRRRADDDRDAARQHRRVGGAKPSATRVAGVATVTL